MEAYSHWLTLNPPNTCSMIRTGYAMFLSEYLLLELCLMVELHIILLTFQAHRMEIADATRRTLEEWIRSLELDNR